MIRYIFHKYKQQLLLLMSIDFLLTILGASSMWLLGESIDYLELYLESGSPVMDILLHFNWCWVFIIIEILFMVFSRIYTFYSAKHYTQINDTELSTYYAAAKTNNVSTSVISARLEMYSDVISFFEINISNLITTFVNVFISLVYLWVFTDFTIAIIVLLSCIIIAFIQINRARRIVKAENLLTKKTELFYDTIENNKHFVYRNYLHRTLNLSKFSLNKQGNITLATRFIQLLILLLVAVYLYASISPSTGVVFGSLIYLYILQIDMVDLPDQWIEFKKLLYKAERVQEE